LTTHINLLKLVRVIVVSQVIDRDLYFLSFHRMHLGKELLTRAVWWNLYEGVM
jgi:hypothetical protein